MRTVGKDCRFLNDRQDPAASSQVSVGKRVAERQQLPTSGVTVHLDDEGVAHYPRLSLRCRPHPHPPAGYSGSAGRRRCRNRRRRSIHSP